MEAYRNWLYSQHYFAIQHLVYQQISIFEIIISDNLFG